MRILLLGGFLGSGKTSVLLPLAKYLTKSGSKVAIIENEIGDISIDGYTMKNEGMQVKELFAGCICCTLGLELEKGIKELAEAESPDWIIIEATGVAYPSAITGNIAGKIDTDLLRTVILADAERLPLILEMLGEMIPLQLEQADLLLLNKIDLVSSEEADKAEELIRKINASAPIYRICAKDGLTEDILAIIAGKN